MEDAQWDPIPIVSMLAKQLAFLEEKCNQLEQRCRILETPNDSKTESPMPVLFESKADEPQDPNVTNDSEGRKSTSSRIKVIITKRDEDGLLYEKEGELPDAKKPDASQHAFILRKIVDFGSEIDIVDDGLWDLLKKQLRWYPYHVFSESAVTLDSPFEPIIFHWNELHEEAFKEGTSGRDKQARDDLKLLLDTISGGSSGDPGLDNYFKARDNYKNQQSRETIQFPDLWTLFPPGTLVYGKPFQDEGQVFLVKDNVRSWPRRNSSYEYEPWKLKVWSWDWENDTLARGSYTLVFDYFDGHRPVTTLPYYPLEKHDNYVSVRSSLIERGKLFQKYCSAKAESRMFYYKGNAIIEMKGFSGMRTDGTDHAFESCSILDHQYTGSDEAGPISAHVDGRVMVDYTSFHQYGSTRVHNGLLEKLDQEPECICPDCVNNEALAERYRTRFDGGPRNAEWDDEQYLLCAPRVLGYILAKKQWAQLQVTCLQEIQPNDEHDAWSSRLRLAEDSTKELLFDLVRCHVSSETEDDDDKNPLSVDDIVPGKGKGLVILLYGPPGVGKTSTAETIAVAARKPLFSISVADVGTKAKHVESNLSKIFALATYWKAILLIDEADVFLESRGRGRIVQTTDKNALVSVFLRVLEYYQGILFLTTNQVAEFDIAIPSRIHIAIRYESLNHKQMQDIFEGFLDNLDTKGLIEDYDEIKEWLKEDVFTEGLDGRQIRNIVITALDLANAEAKYGKGKGKLRKFHLKHTFNNAKAFKRDFMTQMQRYKDSQAKMIK